MKFFTELHGPHAAGVASWDAETAKIFQLDH